VTATAASSPSVLHAAKGRVRIRWSGDWSDGDPDVQRLLRAIAGARSVRASPLTRNVLVEFDERVTDAPRVVAQLERLLAGRSKVAAESARARTHARPVVRKVGRPLRVEPTTLVVVERLARAVGASAGLAVAALRRGETGPRVGPGRAAGVAAGVSLIDGSPHLRAVARRLLGTDGGSAALGAAAVVTQALSGNSLGLAVTGAVAIRQVVESLERRRAARAYAVRAYPPVRAGPWLATLHDGDRLPLAGRILRGDGTAIARDGLPRRVRRGMRLGAGARLFGGPFVAELQPGPRRGVRPVAPADLDSHLRRLDVASFAAGALTFVVTRSVSRAIGVALLLGPRPAVLARESADAGAILRALRCGALPTRDDVVLRRPDIVLVAHPRVLSDGLELHAAASLDPALDRQEAGRLAISVAALAGWPWGPIRGPVPRLDEGDGVFDGFSAHATIGGRRLSLVPERATSAGAAEGFSLVLCSGSERLARFSLRPSLARDARLFREACRRLGMTVVLVEGSSPAPLTRELARAAGVELVASSLATAVRRAARRGTRAAVVTDAGDEAEAEALASATLSIALAAGPSDPFASTADVLVPDLVGAAAVLEASALREASLRDARAVALAAGVVGAARLAWGPPPHRTATTLPNLVALAALGTAWLRFRGGSPSRSALSRLVDPRPERWGRRGVDEVLRALATSERGLSARDAAARAGRVEADGHRNVWVSGVVEQLRSPMTGILVFGAGLSLATGALADVVLICAVIGLNALLAAAQEHQAGSAAAELERLGQVRARVLRDGHRLSLPASEIVLGDVLLLRPGERVAADARVIRSRGLAVDEASLTGESFPVQKRVDEGAAEARVVLDGTDVAVGSGRAAVFAVGRETRFGATAAAIAATSAEEGALGRRLQAMLREVLPVVVAGGALVVGAGLLWRRPIGAQLALAAGTAIAAVPEGLPMLAGVGQAGAARRLAERRALVRRLTAVEVLGRVDVACVDKTGTITENRLSLQTVVAPDGGRFEPRRLVGLARDVLRCAAIASPRADSSSAGAHATDVAVLEAARATALDDGLDTARAAEAPFDAARPFHAAVLGGRLCVKGSVEEVVGRCTHIRRGDAAVALDDRGRQGLLDLAHGLGEEGLRVLMVAEGPGATAVGDPQDLVGLGLLGIRDTVRTGVADAVSRCRSAGIRMIMLTGDHPATARAIGREVGLLDGGRVLSGLDIEHLGDDELAAALEGVSVVARIAPLEKLRVVEALRRRGHVVAMTGDGVNDGPALRLADVGVAMGRGGTEVARQAGDVVLADDDLAALVDALIEGRTFWANLRRSLAMLLGGNLGEVAFIVLLSATGVAAPLTARQILGVNLVSDVLPAMSLVIQAPRRWDLSELAREGESSLGAPLRSEIFTRAVSTAAPAVAAYTVARLLGAPEQSVGFAAIVATQLAQTLQASRAAGGVSRATGLAVLGTGAALAMALHLRPVAAFLGLASPGVGGWLLIAASAGAAPALAQALNRRAAMTRSGGSSLRSIAAATPIHV
jgi:calcium-translocating P-type ATPase